MRLKISVLLIAAMLCVALTGMASAADVKCAWEPCGEKVEQAEIDAVYALTPANMQIMYTDVNSNNRFDQDDVLFIDGIIDNLGSRFEVEVGDVRLTDSCGTYDPNTKVVHGDKEVGQTLKQLPAGVAGSGGQYVVGFVDVNNDFVYDISDPLYVDTDSSGTVTVNDVRLTARDQYPAYSRVAIGDSDIGDALLDTVTHTAPIVTPINDMLGYIDSDCSTTWTCVDKLYLQQLRKVDSTDGSTADKFVTIGDFRLYIPQDAIDNEGWPSCGTKVKQADIDAVYVLSKSPMRIMYTDVNSNNRFDQDDVLFIDGIIDLNEVEVGDVRLTDSCGTYDPNTKVVHGDKEVGQTLKQLPVETGGLGQNVVGFVDVNNDGVYDLSDPLYVDTDASSTVTVNDVRLTTRDQYPAYSRVAIGDSDIGDDLRDPTAPYGTVLITPINDMLGYIDSDCSTTWTCVDKLYLQQINRNMNDQFVTIGDFRLYIPQDAIDNEDWPSCGTKVEQCDIDAVYVLTPAATMQIMYTDVNSNNRFDQDDVLFIDGLMDPLAQGYEVEVGDVRLTDSCGTYDPNTKVIHGDKEIGQTLKQLPVPGGLGQNVVGFVDVNNDGVYDLSDPLYVDTDASSSVTVNDVRLTAKDAYPAYSRVAIGDSDIGDDLRDPVAPYGTVLTTPIKNLLRYIDVDCSTTWTCVDKLYLQQIVGGTGFNDMVVTIGDLRLYVQPWEINGEPIDDPVYNPYDSNTNNEIEIGEMMAAIADWKAGNLSIGDMMEIIGFWKAGSY